MAMLRLASSTVVPLALRAIASPRILSGSIANAFSGTQDSIAKMESPFISHQFSTNAKKLLDHKLVKILKSEIKSKELSLKKSMPPSAHFPFTIQDHPFARSITLTRELDGEKIDVLVSMPCSLTNPIPEDDEEESDFSDTNISDDDKNDNGSGGGADDSSSTDSSDEEKDKSSADPAPSLHLTVKISKENGKSLDFVVSASADEIKIWATSVREPAAEPADSLLCFGPYYFEDLDSDLQFALREFLGIRGINKTNIVGFLYKYMVGKSKRDPMLVLKRLKEFIKE